jgi:hypothetical protein
MPDLPWVARIVTIALGLGACSKSDGPCQRAVEHVFELTRPYHELASEKDEDKLLGSIKSATLRKCRSEGLSQAQATCILGAHLPDWDDQLRGCPAFAAKPPSWVILRPPRNERRTSLGLPPIPDGPRDSKIHFRQLVALPDSMCGLTDAGAVQCWGRPNVASFPAGVFVQIASTGRLSCGREASGTLRCSLGEPASGIEPSEPLTDFALDGWGGCGVRASDQQITCWTILDKPLVVPPGRYQRVVVNHTGGCGLTVDGASVCFGDSPPKPPPLDVLAYSRDVGSCAVDKNHHLACDDPRLGQAPAGTFDTVAMSRGHACASRTNGGTVCWGENDFGECNVPQ